MPVCAAFGCNNRTGSRNRPAINPGVSYFRFPSNDAIRQQWIIAIRREKWQPSSASRVCSDHFKVTDLEVHEDVFTKTKWKRPRENAIPSIFTAFPKHLQKSVSCRKPPVRRNLSLNNEPPKKKRRVASKTVPLENPNLEQSSSVPSTSRELIVECHSQDSSSSLVNDTQIGSPNLLSFPTIPSKNSVPHESLSPDENIIIEDEMMIVDFPENEVEIIPEVVEPMIIEPEPAELVLKHLLHNYCAFSKEPNVTNYQFPKDRAMKTCTPTKNPDGRPVEACTPPKNPQPNKKRGRKKGGKNRASINETPRKKKLRERIEKKNKKIKKLEMSNSRKKKRIAKLTSMFRFLLQRKYVSEDDMQVLEDVSASDRPLLEKELRFLNCDNADLELLKESNGVNKELLERQIAKKKKQKYKRSYGSPLRSFALTLHYLSPRGYKYVRKTFDCCLPHPKTLYKWYQHVDGSPGFTAESFAAIEAKQKASPVPLIISLIIDEISIRKNLETDGRKYYGYEDWGNEAATDSTELANSAFTIMAVGVNGSWKLPLGYFLTSRCTGQQKANLIEQCLRYLHEKGIKKVVSLTSDAPATNIAMMTILGCNFRDPENLKTWFLHPCTQEKIYVFWDACHMVKLVRNTIGDKKILYDPDLGTISWDHFTKLHILQEELGLHLGNKISAKHIFFQKKIMNVKLAVQMLSSSTADALQFLKDNKIDGFEDTEATIEFCRMIDSLFDILNSRNYKQSGFKKPMTRNNFDVIKAQLLKCKAYLKRLLARKNPDLSILKTKRFTGFLGLLVDIESIIGLFESLCMGDPPLLNFLPAYKFSQDHLEIFFGCIRMSCGCNNNPNARQFYNAYRKNLVHMELRMGSSGNCIPLEDITILTCGSGQRKKSSADPEKCINLTAPPDSNDRTFQNLEYEFDDLCLIAELTDEDVNSIISVASDLDDVRLHEYHKVCLENVIYHISGAVVKILKKRVKCKSCKLCLICQEPGLNSSLTSIKNRGGLNHVSNDMLLITRLCEKVLRVAYPDGTFKSSSNKYTAEALVGEVMLLCADCDLFSKIFKQLDNHLVDVDPMHDHKYYLVKAIAMKYLLIRTHFMCKNKVAVVSNRQQFNKLVLFAGQ